MSLQLMVLFTAGVLAAGPFSRADEAPPLIVVNKQSRLPVEDVDQSTDVPARTVFFELNPVEGAAKYNIQVKALSEHWAEAYTPTIETTTLRLRLTPGQYKMRTRSIDGQGDPGHWGPWTTFWVHFHSSDAVQPAENATIQPKTTERERVTFEWPAEKFAKFYMFTLWDENGNMLRHVRTPQTWVALNADLNARYTWRVVPLKTKDEPEPPEGVMHRFQIGGASNDIRGLRVEVNARPHATSYDFEFVKFLEDNKTGEPTVYSSKEPSYRAALAPGEYEMRARTQYDDGSKSNWSPPSRFWVKVANPKHVLPIQGEHIDPTDDLEAKVRIKWQPAKEAKKYRVMVFNQKNEMVEDKTTDDYSLTLGLPHNQTYHWSVIALQDREKTRGPASVSPEDTTAFTIDKYKRLDLNAAEEPSQFYAWGRYLTSNLDYQAENYDNNTTVRQKVFGGTGELAVGYWHRKSDIGALLAASDSGFRTLGKTYTYGYASAMLGYRLMNEKTHSRWRFWAGMAYKETPEVLRSPDNGEIYFSKNRAWAPETRISYLGEINNKFGYQFYASYLTATGTIETVNNLPMKSLYQLNLGVFGTYKLADDMIGMLGYSYQIDAMSYESADEFTHGTNRSSLSGHYLSLCLQLGLEKPLR